MTDLCNSNLLISIDHALDNIYSSLSVIDGDEIVSLHTALGRVLSENCIAPFNLPAYPNSSMDGYAFNSTDIQASDFNLQQVGVSWAGRPFDGMLASGQCVRIFTGAVLPKGADSVIMQELVQVHDHTIHFPDNTQAKQNVRYIGEDVKQHGNLLPAAKQLTAIDLGWLASAGIYEVRVKRKIRIAFFSTGDELRPVGSHLTEGQIYDSNRYTLAALLKKPGHEVNDLGVIADDKAQIQQSLLQAAQSNDVIITSGGASVGDADYIKQILDEIGQVNFWKLAIKPGKPLAFGCIQNCYFFGLPGNPISVIATYQQIVTPALRHLTGLTNNQPIRLKATCKSPLFKKPGRQEFQRGILTQTSPGEFEVTSSGKQGSNIISASSRANCYIVLAREQANVNSGEQVLVEPFNLLL
ncbi:molybdopterin molybdotransferase [Bathymodiolus platifrons methanotrophic gill symbiont]|uniref:molybdopterin molybdotransferase MoeA n=2 Tax=Bathymodiolus platifrons methanotrophic gill symbiont TaxID=113268 RepID=UPI000B40A084|nr:gephyrin-like molybdotransferase Glp [Bathymodiolus platifrons methanotrophic gill symbiont]MCK5870616.1 molybdopterin molybdotransferase MoeA [Methyloprofundus sp.]TXK93898.1 molybdopterin molybdenumtransferase MoeA [Methylococcaceae bacterium CS4]TXK94630.1 molybdopterin molybdenumtransferase MoeA [Methylococcaceae bacterium CS5]TXK94664.1 molybdopterin molybdenumtransferase MoeA [Methylococcaceae bacterium HT1]TXL02866.1 molybdopterin molybdenumtransferase MoeA [Methylococcaceae bacteriu